MHSKVLNSGLLAFLILGLISCGSDDTKEVIHTIEKNTESSEPLKVQYGHPDKSTHEVKDTTQISIDSHLALENETGALPTDTAVDILCHRPPLAEIFRKKMIIQDIEKIEIADIVPVEAFHIRPNGGNTLSCQVFMDIQSESGPDTRVELKRLEVIDFKKYSNYQPLAHLTIKPSQDFMWSDIINQKIKKLKDSQDIILSCEGGQRRLDYQIADKNFNQFEIEKFDNSPARQKCRMTVADSEDLSMNLIGPEFFLNRPLKRLTHLETTYFKPKGPKAILIDHVFARYKFVNNNADDVYLRFHGSGSRFSMAEVFLLGEQPDPFAGLSRRAIIDWHIKGDVQIPVRQGATSLVIVKPGQELEIVGRGSLAYNCMPYIRVQPNQCEKFPRLFGIRSRWEQLPKLTQNRYNTFATHDFQTVYYDGDKPWAKDLKYQDFGMWNPIPSQGCGANPKAYRPTKETVPWPHRCNVK